MGVTTPKTVFFHIPRTGGTWVTKSLLKVFPESDKSQPKAELMNVDVGWPADVNGIHIPPTKVKYKKFSFTFVRHPLAWYQSYYKLKIRELSKNFSYYLQEKKGYYTWLVKQFEKVDFVGRTEYLHFDLEDALNKAGEKFNPNNFHSQRINVSVKKDRKYTKEDVKLVLKNDRYVIKKYYSDYDS